MKKITVQDHWDRFERWAHRYQKACVDLVVSDDYGDENDPAAWLFAANVSEVMAGEDAGPPDLLDIEHRVAQKIGLLRGYFVNISSDGAEFMDMKSRFLTLQYPGRCNDALGFWLEQDLEGASEAGAYHGFVGFGAQVFLRDPTDLDFASVRAVLPFDFVTVRKPRGEPWTASDSISVLRTIREDLEFDGYEFRAEVANSASMFLEVHFRWM